MEYRKFRDERFPKHLISTPFIWLPLVAFLFLDLLITIYQAVCFPLYGLKKVKRSKYILIRDRNKLAYLSPLEKMGCMYCGYANGLLLYAKEIGGLTEKYWCGIMHENKPGFQVQNDQIKRDFAAFNDPKDFKKKYNS